MPEGLFVLHVSNISPTATREQVHQLFGILGDIEEFRVRRMEIWNFILKVYPTEIHPQYSSMNQRLAFIKYHDERAVEVGTHMTNTIFIDRAIVCIPSQNSRFFKIFYDD
jgi:arginine/serine-rich splicing factor 12